MKKDLLDKDAKDTKYYIGNICHQFPDLHLSLYSQLIQCTEAANGGVL